MLNFKQHIIQKILSLPGWHTNRQIVVIESDDWGSIRMPSVVAMKKLCKAGMQLENDPYSVYDSLETLQDLDIMFNLLHSLKDKNGRHPVVTANTVMANPDFTKIKASGFQNYYYEPFTETLNRTQQSNVTFDKMKDGITAGVYFPQFHGREHVNVKRWLSDLKNDAGSARMWFENASFGTSNLVDSKQKCHYMTSWDSNAVEDLRFYEQSVIEGLALFEAIFGFKSKSIIAPTYVWPLELEKCFFENGIEFLQGVATQQVPIKNGNRFKTKRTNFQGTRAKSGLLYLNRNAFFEPSMNPNFDWEGDCLQRIKVAFEAKKPVTISTHRLNFMGSLNSKNRSSNLIRFESLLQTLLKRWPNVEFMSSVELGNLIKTEI